MTQTRKPRTARTLLALALVLAGFALLAALLAPGTARSAAPQVQQPQNVVAAVPTQQTAPATGIGTGVSADLALFQIASADGEILTPAQSTEVLYAADRICEGFTAKVPVADMLVELQVSQGLDPEQAQAFMDAAAYGC